MKKKLRKLSADEIAELFEVDAKHFHRVIKYRIKKDFKAELKKMDIDNPDILLCSENNIWLANPSNSIHPKPFETKMHYSTYKEN